MDEGTPVGRRIVLGMLGLGALGIATGAPVSRWVNRVGSKLPSQVAGALPGQGFRYYTVTNEPSVSDADYQLHVSGLVDRPASLSLTDLGRLPQTDLVKDFQCVTGWRVAGVPWAGVLLRDVLDHCGVSDQATALELKSFDGVYTESLTMEQARRDDVLVATRMLGAPVTKSHGGPVRLYVAPMYGYKSLKWLGEVVVTDQVDPGFWEVRGYDVDAWIGRSNGRSDAPV
jgi:DMSO/TMAO reductase YedYZ molybdopterin-dependent catalytic subunit